MLNVLSLKKEGLQVDRPYSKSCLWRVRMDQWCIADLPHGLGEFSTFSDVAEKVARTSDMQALVD